MEQFKSKTGKEVRIASRSGHVTIVGKEFKPVPPALEQKAMAAGLVPKTLYDEVRGEVAEEVKRDLRDEVRDEIRKEMAGNPHPTEEELAEGPADSDVKTTPPDAKVPATEADEEQQPGQDKNSAIIGALTRIKEESGAGKVETEGGNKLLHNNKPVLGAVSEYAGFPVNNADIEAALQ